MFFKRKPLLDFRHYCKLSWYAISRKTNDPNLRKMTKNLVPIPILASLAQSWDIIFFFKILFLSATRYHALHEKCPYSEFFWSVFPRIRTEYGQIFRISPYSVRMQENAVQKNSEYAFLSRRDGQLSSCTILEKTNNPILRKVRDGRTNRKTDKSDFVGRCPTNVERPTLLFHKYVHNNPQISRCP